MAKNEMNGRISEEILEAYKIIAPYMSELTFNELSTGITDTEKFIAYYKGTYLDLGIKVGDTFKPGSPVDMAIKSKKRIIKHIPKNAGGIPYIITANPIFGQNGEVIGAIATGTATEKEVMIIEAAAELSTAMEQMGLVVHDQAVEMDKVSLINGELLELSGHTQESVKNTNEILEYIRDIANETKVLGINASIEAARAGQQGLGFKVVASEIQKLADNSMKSVKRIEETLKNIQDTVGIFVSKVTEFNSFVNSQVASTEETYATIEQLKNMSSNMQNFVKDIV